LAEKRRGEAKQAHVQLEDIKSVMERSTNIYHQKVKDLYNLDHRQQVYHSMLQTVGFETPISSFSVIGLLPRDASCHLAHLNNGTRKALLVTSSSCGAALQTGNLFTSVIQEFYVDRKKQDLVRIGNATWHQNQEFGSSMLPGVIAAMRSMCPGQPDAICQHPTRPSIRPCRLARTHQELLAPKPAPKNATLFLTIHLLGVSGSPFWIGVGLVVAFVSFTAVCFYVALVYPGMMTLKWRTAKAAGGV
jgi:hypothetical protein